MPSTSTSRPDVAALLAPLLARIPEDQVPLLLALAERRAAERYRTWAASATDQQVRTRLLECAGREEEIARRVEGLVEDPAAIQHAIEQQIPELPELIREAFESRSLHEAFALQAEGERLGAATWRSLARKAESTAAREAFSGCAELEEQSADVLEALLAGQAWPFAEA